MLKEIMICSAIVRSQKKGLNSSAKLFIANYSLNSNCVDWYLSDLEGTQQKAKALDKEDGQNQYYCYIFDSQYISIT